MDSLYGLRGDGHSTRSCSNWGEQSMILSIIALVVSIATAIFVIWPKGNR